MQSYETLRLSEPTEHVLLVEFARPVVSNAINTAMGYDLCTVWDRLNADPGQTRCVILTGEGDRAFCAGGDLKERNGMSDSEWQAQHRVFERMVRAFQLVPVPIIAAVNGAAYGGGCEFALCCDFIYASENATFALTEVTLGIMPGSGGTQLLPRSVGTQRAMEIILTGTPFSAGEAQQWGMVNSVFPSSDLLAAAIETASRIARNAPLGVRQAKHAIVNGMQMDMRAALMFEIEAYNRLPGTDDRREGVRAFNEKRSPVFMGS